MLKYKGFQDIYSQHLTQAFVKENFENVWKIENDKLDCACKNKFRADSDIGYALCRYWQIFTGKFSPSKLIGKYYIMSDNNKEVVSAIKKKKHKVICINDANLNVDFEKAKREINLALDEVFPEKSDFEI